MKPLDAAILSKVTPKTMQDDRRRQWTIWGGLILLLVQRDLRVRYRGSFFGYLWSMMNPLLYMIILSFVFSHVMRFKVENFSLFILSGILVWNLFQQSLMIGVNSIVNNGSLLKKVKVPAMLFPAANVASVFVNFLLALVPFMLLSLVLTGGIHPTLLLLPIFLLPFLLFIFGCVLFLAALNVSFRDVSHVMEPLLTILFYATPIVYPASSLPDRVKNVLALNPLSHFLESFRNILFEGQWPELRAFGLQCLFAAISIAVGTYVFRRNRDRFIYDL